MKHKKHFLILQHIVFIFKPTCTITRGWVCISATFTLDCCDTWWPNIRPTKLQWSYWNSKNRIVCPRSLRNSDIWYILSDPNFFTENKNKGVLVLKKYHHEGHFTNCQLQMSQLQISQKLSQFWWHFCFCFQRYDYANMFLKKCLCRTHS